jgi:hypothetical protein
MKTIINIKRYINARKMTLFYATALVIGVFGTAAPSKAGSITAFNYLYGLYKWWSIGSTHNYYQVIKVRVTFQGGALLPTTAAEDPWEYSRAMLMEVPISVHLRYFHN